jgi:hypothetical protein
MASASAGAFLFFTGFKVDLITMVFVTWLTFRHYQMINPLRSGADYLRAPDRSSRCDEYTDEERERLTTRR